VKGERDGRDGKNPLQNKLLVIWRCCCLFIESSVSPAAALQVHWWNAVRLATLCPWLLRSSALVRRAALNPYPILHRRQQHVALETGDVTLPGGAFSADATPTAEPEAMGKCDSIRKPVSSSPSSAHA